MLKEYDIQEVVVETSPFLRTMMTASIFLKHLKNEIASSKMEKNERLREILLSKIFKEDPGSKMLSNRFEKEQFCKKYLCEQNYLEKGSNGEVDIGKYPENYESGHIRCKKAIESIIERHSSKKNNVAHIVVTHGIFVGMFASKFEQVESSINSKKKFVEYCGISAGLVY